MAVLRQAPDPSATPAFLAWVRHCEKAPGFSPKRAVEFAAGHAKISVGAIEAYGAPFPEGDDRERYLGAARAFPSLVPVFADGGARGGMVGAGAQQRGATRATARNTLRASRLQRAGLQLSAQ